MPPVGEEVVDMKLPGSLIADTEDLDSAAHRVTDELTGVRNLPLRQMKTFSDPCRVNGMELDWINNYYNVRLTRVITVVFFAMVRLDERLVECALRKNASWVPLDEVKRLALDHNNILIAGIDHMTAMFDQGLIPFECLPHRFTLRQLQNLFEAALGKEMDNRNFRKKMLAQELVVATGEYECNVPHKQAMYYMFKRKTTK
jgi:hypothetical protein